MGRQRRNDSKEVRVTGVDNRFMALGVTCLLVSCITAMFYPTSESPMASPAYWTIEEHIVDDVVVTAGGTVHRDGLDRIEAGSLSIEVGVDDLHDRTQVKRSAF